jgi:flavin reductase (DIM6/NTAB) family NADH-FMN oxidoreductase RutF
MDITQRKKALRLLTYGLYVVTARDESHLAAGTITWFSQSSFDPPLVMAGIQRKSSLNRIIHASRAFAVHFVGKGQKKLATAFFKTAHVKGNTINGYRFEDGLTGAPVLVDPPGWIECRVVDEVNHGDHTVFIAEVVAADVRRDEEPLTLREAGFSYGG